MEVAEEEEEMTSKLAHRLAMRKWRADPKNKKKIKADAKRYYWANRDKIIAKNSAYLKYKRKLNQTEKEAKWNKEYDRMKQEFGIE